MCIRDRYFWGGVGRGKSFLMDCFYDSVPYVRKRRIHFHAFMHGVHPVSYTHLDVYKRQVHTGAQKVRGVADGFAG